MICASRDSTVRHGSIARAGCVRARAGYGRRSCDRHQRRYDAGASCLSDLRLRHAARHVKPFVAMFAGYVCCGYRISSSSDTSGSVTAGYRNRLSDICSGYRNMSAFSCSDRQCTTSSDTQIVVRSKVRPMPTTCTLVLVVKCRLLDLVVDCLVVCLLYSVVVAWTCLFAILCWILAV